MKDKEFELEGKNQASIINNAMNDTIREINLMRHFDWSAEEREARINSLKRAKEVNKGFLDTVTYDNYQSRMLLAGQQGVIEHYLELCEKEVSS